jgi:CheY-like chemotaxis protein
MAETVPPWSSTTRAQGGLGLGLSIVRHVVELHGGTVSAMSEGKGRGASFEVVLPSTPAALHREAPGRLPAAPPSSGAVTQSVESARLLVVDDAPDSREVVAVLLQEAGAIVRVAASADEAIDLYDRETFDIVLSDIAMPDVDGYALLGMLQRRSAALRRPLRAIALTAHGRREDRENTLKAGFAAHLTKPIDPPEVLATIARVLRER